MLFNSYEFIFAFVPLVLLGYHGLLRAGRERASKAWLVAASLCFYAWWYVPYLPLLLGSIAVNYGLYRWLEATRRTLAARGKLKRRRKKTPQERRILLLALGFNVALLMFFKYVDFFLANVNAALGSELPFLRIALPLGISFFTLQQITFQVDAYEGGVEDRGPLSYALFVSFFPQLVAGPIVHHKEMIPQFLDPERLRFRADAFFSGVWLFVIGLFKKVVVADTFAVWASAGFDGGAELSFLPAWAAALSFTFQIYFDFSGYSDMAIGLGRMFGVDLPINFNSPFRATSITGFWNRWHMTLTAFITTYVHYPIARALPRGLGFSLLSILLAMFIAGFWHGAAWTFVCFGLLHGLGLVAAALTRARGIQVPAALGWLLTMGLVVVANVFFRAQDFAAVERLLEGMFLANGVEVGRQALAVLTGPAVMGLVTLLGYLGLAFASVWWPRNSVQIADAFRPTPAMALAIPIVFWIALTHFSSTTPFIYFEF